VRHLHFKPHHRSLFFLAFNHVTDKGVGQNHGW
jgi:hypothetical protein